MDYSTEGWVEVPMREFRKLYESSNPLRDNWSNGHLFYERVGEERRTLGFCTQDARVLVPPEIHQKYFT
jgi:hypothetical protein